MNKEIAKYEARKEAAAKTGDVVAWAAAQGAINNLMRDRNALRAAEGLPALRW